jgi:hypothetical protein
VNNACLLYGIRQGYNKGFTIDLFFIRTAIIPFAVMAYGPVWSASSLFHSRGHARFPILRGCPLAAHLPTHTWYFPDLHLLT